MEALDSAIFEMYLKLTKKSFRFLQNCQGLLDSALLH